MSEVRGVIPKVVVLIIGLVLTLVFNVPGPIEIGIIILEALHESFPHYITPLLILFLRIFGVLLMIISFVLIVVQARAGEYF